MARTSGMLSSKNVVWKLLKPHIETPGGGPPIKALLRYMPLDVVFYPVRDGIPDF